MRKIRLTRVLEKMLYENNDNIKNNNNNNNNITI